jgi:hypothetical protein
MNYDSGFEIDPTINIPPKNARLSEPFHLGNGIVVRMLIEDNDPRLKMVLEINENTSFDAISKNRKFIKKFFRDLIDIQGSDLNLGYIQALADINDWHEQNQGLGWGRLSFVLNYLSLALILFNYDERKKMQGRSQPSTDTKSLLSIGISEPINLLNVGGYTLYTLFIAFKLPPESFDEFTRDTYHLLETKQLPFGISDGPFDTRMIRDSIRNFKKHLATGKIRIIRPKMNSLEIIEEFLLLRGYFEKTNLLLDKNPKPAWKRNKQLFLNRIIRISTRVEKSQHPIIVELRTKQKSMGET